MKFRYLLARRHLVTERNRDEFDEVSNKRLTSMAADVASGLAYLAELKYVHRSEHFYWKRSQSCFLYRDVACRNCLVNSDRNVKLADFGMTRPMSDSQYYRFSRKGWECFFTIKNHFVFQRHVTREMDVTRKSHGWNIYSNV